MSNLLTNSPACDALRECMGVQASALTSASQLIGRALSGLRRAITLLLQLAQAEPSEHSLIQVSELCIEADQRAEQASSIARHVLRLVRAGAALRGVAPKASAGASERQLDLLPCTELTAGLHACLLEEDCPICLNTFCIGDSLSSLKVRALLKVMKLCTIMDAMFAQGEQQQYMM
ncbi:hypothetical protein MMC07_000405 [Pseudocyphellaria aurata]|nr:hypothetical protein [Pseudocyphellaria aurata]